MTQAKSKKQLQNFTYDTVERVLKQARGLRNSYVNLIDAKSASAVTLREDQFKKAISKLQDDLEGLTTSLSDLGSSLWNERNVAALAADQAKQERRDAKVAAKIKSDAEKAEKAKIKAQAKRTKKARDAKDAKAPKKVVKAQTAVMKTQTKLQKVVAKHGQATNTAIGRDVGGHPKVDKAMAAHEKANAKLETVKTKIAAKPAKKSVSSPIVTNGHDQVSQSAVSVA